MKLQHYINSKSYSPANRKEKWQQISDITLCSSRSVARPNFDQLSNADLANLFELIDQQFFLGQFRKQIHAQRHSLSFRVSKRMTSSGGITTTKMPLTGRGRLEFEIAISSTLLFESFQDKRPISVTGMLCSNRLQALMRIMEHEMIHLCEMMLWRDSSCSKHRFKDIAFRFFGHRQSTHQLLAPSDNAANRLKIMVGDDVAFHRGTEELCGYVNRITKRATVLVPCRTGTLYTDGQKYQKYYVPLTKLKKAA